MDSLSFQILFAVGQCGGRGLAGGNVRRSVFQEDLHREHVGEGDPLGGPAPFGGDARAADGHSERDGGFPVGVVGRVRAVGGTADGGERVHGAEAVREREPRRRRSDGESDRQTRSRVVCAKLVSFDSG